jgi:hypothetical protein
MNRSKHVLIISVIFAALFSSCTINQEVFIEADSSGAVHFDIEVEEFFNEVVEDFTVFAPEEESDVTQMNIDDIQDSLNKSPYTRYAVLEEIVENRYVGTFQFVDASLFFNDVEDELNLEDLFTFEKSDDTTLSFYLDMDNYAELTELIPLLKDPSFSIFGPEENVGVSEADYLDMISYLLGEEGPDAVMRSNISLIMNTDSPIKSHKGGTVITDTQIRFDIPMIDFLLLAQPISYSVTW